MNNKNGVYSVEHVPRPHALIPDMSKWPARRSMTDWTRVGPTGLGNLSDRMSDSKFERKQARRTAMDRSNIDNSWNREKLV